MNERKHNGSLIGLKWLASMILLFAFVAPTHAQVALPNSLTIANHSIQASVTLSDNIAVDITVEFENSIGLHANNIDVQATLLSPTDPSIVDRLPSSLINADNAFPVLVSISPKSDAGFGFEGVAMIELYTTALHYVEGTPLRLFRSHDNGEFEDITMLTASGSFRARGNTGSFSDFIILADMRSLNVVLDEKFNALSNVLATNRHNIKNALLQPIDVAMGSLYTAISLQNYAMALTQVDTLIGLIQPASGNNIPDVWRSAGDIINVKGELLTHLYTLRYSLRTN
ncbi:hypothetical protein OPS25_14455 [Alteromonas ponticola]|uniref:Cohesin domain-containing protein n=1 Tax=Alteromonas aquimaris TaxID=2998417 RepID=A0ABT3PA98_9ALTE|nr:DUF6689 family protein [Alteromonas aquimaris]MCW8109708.1 hypothetical protein [Alteromonas aquimaris]